MIRLLFKKNIALSRNLTEEDVERAIDQRLSNANAKDHVVYPEELQRLADAYVGSAGKSLRPADRTVHGGIVPFRTSIGYDNESVSSLLIICTDTDVIVP
jgi:hypothetical protein